MGQLVVEITHRKSFDSFFVYGFRIDSQIHIFVICHRKEGVFQLFRGQIVDLSLRLQKGNDARRVGGVGRDAQKNL